MVWPINVVDLLVPQAEKLKLLCNLRGLSSALVFPLKKQRDKKGRIRRVLRGCEGFTINREN